MAGNGRLRRGDLVVSKVHTTYRTQRNLLRQNFAAGGLRLPSWQTSLRDRAERVQNRSRRFCRTLRRFSPTASTSPIYLSEFQAQKNLHLAGLVVVDAGGFEPPTARFVAEYSIQLSYASNLNSTTGGEGGIRTLDRVSPIHP